MVAGFVETLSIKEMNFVHSSTLTVLKQMFEIMLK